MPVLHLLSLKIVILYDQPKNITSINFKNVGIGMYIQIITPSPTHTYRKEYQFNLHCLYMNYIFIVNNLI